MFNRFDQMGLVLLFLAVTCCGYGFSRFQSNTEDVLQWLPDKSKARLEYDDFEKKFGSDDFLVVTWDDCTIDDPRLEGFCDQLLALDSAQYIQSVINGTDIVEKLAAETELSPKFILNRFKGIFFGTEDSNQTLALIELSKAGSANRRKSLEQIESAIEATPDLNLDEVVFGGYPFVAITVDNQLQASFLYFLLPSIFFASIVSLSCLRDVYLSSIVFFTAICAAACSIAIVPFFGQKFGGLMTIIPALVYILTTSGSIHLIFYSLDSIGDPRRLLSIGWKPCAISALTTAIGMLSLLRSSFPAIRSFGLFCATGVGFALVFQLVIIPWLLYRFGKPGQKRLALRPTPGRFLHLATGVQRNRWLLAIVGIVFMVISVIGLAPLKAQVAVGKLFADDSPVITSLTSLERRLGPIDQAEFLIEFENVDKEDFHVRAKLVYQIQRYLVSLDEISAMQSLHNYLPREPRGGRLRSVVKQQLYQASLQKKRVEFGTSSFLDVDNQSETWRLSIRFPFTEETDFAHLKKLVLDSASFALEKLSAHDDFRSVVDSPIHLGYTGKNHLFHEAQTSLLEDLYKNFLMAFVIITPVLIFVLGSWKLGLLAMLPNLFPIVVFFGGLGWFGWPVDLAIAMTASVALGIAVDDTTHFLIRFREYGGNSKNLVNPIRKALSQCGPAMLNTTAIGCTGLLVYGVSEMIVVRNFSLSIAGMLILALLADVFFLPALLLLFAKESNESEELEEAEPK